MGRASVWDVMVDTLGVRGARRVGSFMECWATTERRWSEEPAPGRFTHEWEMSAAEVAYFLREFRRAFPGEHSPTRIVRDVRALVGHAGIDALQTATRAAPAARRTGRHVSQPERKGHRGFIGGSS